MRSQPDDRSARCGARRPARFPVPCGLNLRLPLDRAADRRHLDRRPAAGAGDLHHGVEQLARRVRLDGASRVVETATILEPELAVVAEEIRRAYRAIRLGDLLRLIP